MKSWSSLFAVFIVLGEITVVTQGFVGVFFITYPYLSVVLTLALVSVPWAVFFYYHPFVVKQRWARSYRGRIFPAEIEATDPSSGRVYTADSFDRAELGITHTAIYDDHFRRYYDTGHVVLTAAVIFKKGPPDISTKSKDERGEYLNRVNRMMAGLNFQYTMSAGVRPAEKALERMRERKSDLELAVKQAKEQGSKNLAEFQRDLNHVERVLKRVDEQGDKILEGVHYTLITVRVLPGGNIEQGLNILDTRVMTTMTALSSLEVEAERALRYDLLDIIKTSRADLFHQENLLSGSSLDMAGIWPIHTLYFPSTHDGVYVGKTLPGQVPMFFSFDRGVMNPHMCVVGDTGSGKTTLIQTVIASAAAMGYSILILDSQGDFVPTTLRYGGKVLTVGENALHNPFAVLGVGTDLQTHQNIVISHFTEVLQLSEPQVRWLETIIAETYKGVGISLSAPQTWRRRPPTIVDIHASAEGRLKSMNEGSGEYRAVQVLAQKLAPWATNPKRMGLYIGETSSSSDEGEFFDLQASELLDGFYCVDTTRIPDDARLFVTLTILEQLKYVLRLRGTPERLMGLIVVDEARNTVHKDKKKMDESHILVELMLTLRKYGRGLTVATQEPGLLAGPLVTQPDILSIFKLKKDTALKDMAKQLQLPSSAEDDIRSLDVGECFIKTGARSGLKTYVDRLYLPPVVRVSTSTLSSEIQIEEKAQILKELHEMETILSEDHLLGVCRVMPGNIEQETRFHEAVEDLLDNQEIVDDFLLFPDLPTPTRLFGLPDKLKSVAHRAIEEYLLRLFDEVFLDARSKPTPDIEVGEGVLAIEVETGLKHHGMSDTRRMVSKHPHMLRLVIVPDKIRPSDEDLVDKLTGELKGLPNVQVLQFTKVGELPGIVRGLIKNILEEGD